jgi:hypothetical protein
MYRKKFSSRVYFGPPPKTVRSPDPDKIALDKFKEGLERTNESSQQLFEKQLTTLAAGSIGVSVAFIDKIIPMATSILPGLLFFGWLSMVITILANMISHRVSHSYHYATITEIQMEEYDPLKAIKRNRKIGYWNNFTIGTLVLGLMLIMLFITINLIDKHGRKASKDSKPTPLNQGASIDSSRSKTETVSNKTVIMSKSEQKPNNQQKGSDKVQGTPKTEGLSRHKAVSIKGGQQSPPPPQPIQKGKPK